MTVREFDKHLASILIKTTFTTFFNIAFILDPNLSADLTKFSDILLSLATTTSKILNIPLEEILQMQEDFPFLKTLNILKRTNLYSSILSCFFNPYKEIRITLDNFSNEIRKLEIEKIITLPLQISASTPSILPASTASSTPIETSINALPSTSSSTPLRFYQLFPQVHIQVHPLMF